MLAGLDFKIGLLTIGLVSMFLVWAVLNLIPRSRNTTKGGTSIPVLPEIQQSTDAVLIAESGGRVGYLNALARQWFALGEDEPADLERLLRRVRPMDDFLDVCSHPGQKRLTVNGKLLEATSYEIPGTFPMVLVSFRALDLTPSLANGEADGSILKISTDFSQAIAASLDLGTTIQAVLDNVNRLVPAEVMELKVWDAAHQTLIPYWGQEPGSGSQGAARISQSQFGSLTAQLINTRQPLLLEREKIKLADPASRIQSYLGLPLLAGGDLVGTLEAGQFGAATFGQHDLELLRFISGQAAVAIRNSVLYEDEQRRAAELAGLANLTQAVSAIRDPKELFNRLVESVAPLFDAEIIGFLLYDETRRILEGQVPFRGLPPSIVQIYRATIAPDSPAERILNYLKPILTIDASQDENWHTLGLTNVAVAASLRDSALAPLVSGGRTMGYLQVSHHRRGTSSFTSEEVRLMNIVATQAAAIIENALLVQQSRSRAQRSDALRRIASLSASAATVDEVLKYSMQELVHLFQADAGGIYLVDEERGQLHMHRESVWNVPENVLDQSATLYVDNPEYLLTVSHTRRPFMSGRLSTDRRILSIYRPLSQALQMESTMVVPLVVREHSLGELMLGSKQADHFSAFDLQVVSTAAGQLAAAVESSRLLGQTDVSLRRRVEQLSSIARISRELGSSLELKHLLTIIHAESLRILGADCGSILIIENGDPAEGPAVKMAVGCPTSGPSTLDQKVIQSGESIIVADFNASGGHPPHDDIRSALVSPILYQGKAVGVMNFHSAHPSFFGSEALEITEVLAGQAAIAIQNAIKYMEERQRSELLRRRAEAFSKLTDTAHALYHDLPLEQALQTIAQSIRASTPFRAVLVSLYEPETGYLRRVTGVGFAQEILNELLSRKQPLAAIQQLMRPEFKVSRSYFIPADQTPILPAEVHYVYANAENSFDAVKNAWNADDFLLIPLEDAQGNMLGHFSLDDPADGLRPDRATIESAEGFAAQATLVISNSLRFNNFQNRIVSLSDGIQRQQKLLSVSQNDLPMLLRKDLEQTISLHNLERRAQRIRAGLAITESVSRQLDAVSALKALGTETLTQLGMSAALVAENAAEGPRLMPPLGSIPRATNVEALFGQRNPLRMVLQTGDPILTANLDEDDEWRDTPLLTSLRAKGMICLPVVVKNQIVAAMLAVTPEPLPTFTDEDRQVYFQISRQTSVILQNIYLLNETSRRLQEVDLLLDFSRRIAGLSPDEMLKSLLESARRVISNAHAGVAMLWNPQVGLLIPRAISGYADNASLLRVTYRSGEALPGIVFESRKPRRADEVNFLRDYALTSENLLHYRQGTGGRLPVSSLLIPILAGGKNLGLLVLDNFNTVAAFKADDEALLISLAQQLALSLENVRLVQTTQERASQMEALNEAAASLTSSLRSDELVASLLERLQPILPYDTATLWLREKERLVVGSAVGFPDNERRLGLSTFITDSALFNEMTRSGHAIAVGDVREDQRFPQLDTPRLSWLGIPLFSKGELAGMIALEKWQAYFYHDDYVQVAMTFASQAAVSLENARLYEDSLNRATELTQRSQRLASLNRFSSSLNGLLDADQILQITSEELRQAISVTRVSAVIIESDRAVWKSSTPAVTRPLPQVLPPAPLFGRLRESLGVFNTSNVKREKDLIPLAEFVGANTVSLLALPLISGTELRALLFAHAEEEGYFGLNEIETARTIANQAAIALENARLYQTTLQTAQRLSIINESSAEIGATLDLEQIFAAVDRSAKKLMPAESFVISLYDEINNEIEGVYLIDRGVRVPSIVRPMDNESLTGQVIRTGRPIMTNTPEDTTEAGGLQYGKNEEEPLSLLAVPMVSPGGKATGMLSVQSYEPNAYTTDDLQILGTLANQSIVAIQNSRLFAETQRLAQELEQRVIERTAQLTREQQNTVTLLRILTEVSSSLDLDRALNRTLSLLNDATGAEQGTIMLLNPDDYLLHYRAGYGYLSERSEPNSTRGFTLKVGEGLAGWVVQNREAVLVEDLYNDPRWVHSSTGQEHHSSIVAPLLVGEDVIGVLMIFNREKAFFSPDILNLVKAIASQVAVAINNAHLYELIRDQAERLGSMLRKEQEEASRSQNILEAVADGVLVTGADNTISFANTSIERILDVRPESMLGQSLESFGGLFGNTAELIETIHRWSEEPSAYDHDSYAQQLELETGRIALIHLAPVIFQNDFLGTVSIFRDITHEVEVDRLKSEFVATVSHELRTPLTSIKGYADILLMGAAGAFNENQTHFLQIIKNNSERLNILVNDLLDISRIEAGRVTLTPQPIDLHGVAEDVLGEMLRRSQEEGKPMAISLDAPKELPRVLGDPERVRQIIANLVDNAYNYTPENGTIKIRIHAMENSEIQVDVEDNGVGISLPDQNRVFERFHRGEHPLVLATPGTGLGLPIVRQLVEMHSGRIWMQSQGIPGKGSVFSFTLPTQKN
jgi:GAF domain-containing protein/nitrogen-specific signal transduction histidine kinase